MTVKVEAPTLEEAVQILKGLRPKYETHHKAKLTDEALEAAVRLPIDILLAVSCRIRPSMSWTKRARGRASTL